MMMIYLFTYLNKEIYIPCPKTKRKGERESIPKRGGKKRGRKEERRRKRGGEGNPNDGGGGNPQSWRPRGKRKGGEE